MGGGKQRQIGGLALRTSRRLLDTEILESLSSSPAHRSSSSSSVTAISFKETLALWKSSPSVRHGKNAERGGI
jgi:hypothetical protein